jgi:hypothetical protein
LFETTAKLGDWLMLGTQMPAEQRDLVDFSYPVSIASPEVTADVSPR